MKIFHIKSADATPEMKRRFADLVEALTALGISQYILMDACPALEARFDELKVPFIIQKFSGLFDLRTQQAAQQIAESFGPHLIQSHSPESVTVASKIQFNAVRIGFATADETQHKRTLAASDIVLAVSYPQQGAALDYDILTVPPLVQDLCPDGNAAQERPVNKQVIGCMLDLTQAYQFEPVLQALRDIPGVHFQILGSGPAAKNWQASATRQAVQDRVTFLETAPAPRDFFCGLDLCVVPYRSSGIDRLTLEAWSCGLCVLTGMPAERSPVDDKVNGMFVTGTDVMGWRKMITDLLEKEEMRKKLGAAGRQKYLASHNSARAISAYLQAYETALRVKA